MEQLNNELVECRKRLIGAQSGAAEAADLRRDLKAARASLALATQEAEQERRLREAAAATSGSDAAAAAKAAADRQAQRARAEAAQEELLAVQKALAASQRAEAAAREAAAATAVELSAARGEVARGGAELRKVAAEAARWRKDCAAMQQRATEAESGAAELQRLLVTCEAELEAARRALDGLRNAPRPPPPPPTLKSGFGEFVHLRREVKTLKHALATAADTDAAAGAPAAAGVRAPRDEAAELPGADAAAGLPPASPRAGSPGAAGTPRATAPPLMFARGRTSMLQSALEASVPRKLGSVGLGRRPSAGGGRATWGRE